MTSSANLSSDQPMAGGDASPHSSDNDANERPVREKLRETSIANSAQEIDQVLQGHCGTTNKSVNNNDLKTTSPSASQRDELRGRLGRKRSFDEVEQNASVDNNDILKSDSRKRSRESQEQRSVDPDQGSKNGLDHVLDDKGALSGPGHVTSGARDIRTTEQSPHGQRIGNDEDLTLDGSVFSPRRKRSREQVDTDAQREQKIVATEEARASRQSDEIQRSDDRSQGSGLALDPTLAKTATSGCNHGLAEAASGIPGSARQKSHSINDIEQTKTEVDEEPVDHPKATPTSSTTTDPFQKSGLAAFSQSTTSGFGALGSPGSSNANRSIFSSTTADSKGEATDDNASAGLRHDFAGGVEIHKPSPFAAVSSQPAMKASPFGTTVFGGFGVGGGFGKGPSIRSFAARNGDVDLQGAKYKVEVFGAPEKGDGDDNNSESGEGNSEGSVSGDEPVNNTGKFQHREVDTGEEGEESIYNNGRSSLYGFSEGSWRERGKGVFKVNVKFKGDDDPGDAPGHKSARFIMRAHQTHRVLLNTPIFKEMKFGDVKGKEPTTKSVTFAVADEEKLTPYTLKLSDLNEAKILFHTVQTLQADL